MASPYDPVATDPPLLDRNSEIKTYTTSRFTYPGLRIFYRRHQQADRLPKSPAPIPLLVFIHGLGGSVAQFHPLLTSLTSIASCLAIDLPGCGRSEFSVRQWEAYTTDALVELLETIIEDYREKEDGQGVVLIGHSMGASLAALLASPRLPPRTQLHDHVAGLIAVCPTSGFSSQKQIMVLTALLWVPEIIFNLWRAWDKRGGSQSASVRRFVGADADPEAKRLQDLYNNQAITSVWRRMAWGCLPTHVKGVTKGGLPSKETWEKLNVPVFLVGGEDDRVTPPQEIAKIRDFLQEVKTTPDTISPGTSVLADSAAPVDINAAASKIDAMTSLGQGEENTRESEDQKPVHRTQVAEPEEGADDPVTPTEQAASLPSLSLHRKKIVRSIIMGKPATHALLYTPSTVRILAGLISDFMVVHITGRLDLGWQLQYLSRDGKWDVKNLQKWQAVEPVSEPIGGIFRAIKTLREVDEDHSPSEFVKKWGGVIKDVIDISHDNPVYNPQGLEKGGIHYHKFPTVSKVPPTDAEIKGFIELVDKVRDEQKERAKRENWGEEHYIGVHCHYGFNRTGFFLVCYLVERCGYTPEAAIEHFAQSRPKGIKHAHFKDRLYVRYSGLRSEAIAEH
ncbi:hypothetical protein GE21DRAFT_4866 [Neurospora crassa]|uniref:Dual specificity phosphatase n=1 Tax=Neurospora crassa (strain ATCC 24698 / 74-OR23-1A / CBS 708.71 / DSM 1257 / FGSC 987) TaxID=367110 RepID=U9WH41_NEUCR|nr:dual specificity phosphatase [Neurospora crassa OR74A]XP_011393975.1 dual specificity phosphatase, variant [Neurospora crassa OR74A]ESA43408.1 dual specificity phosphatase [Neurospora crassa OR74A]ESA43409.1 dual specificity phosphatase, variant [Neurospora crassa OR74A]KHE81998.1 hypothetical protein GE21DRAFT_4866 [Neurospora crassa]|eukprot:XP_011393974.1 dual specificity phosphatase [Neurospora crassa OR74A]